MIFVFLTCGCALALIPFDSVFILKTAKLCFVTGVIILFLYYLSLMKVVKPGLAPWIIRTTDFMSYIFIYLIAFLSTSLLAKVYVESEFVLIYGKVITALKVVIVGCFLRVIIGKAIHQQAMEQFFISSGLPLWLHYFVMASETLGALGILLDFRYNTGIVAAGCLLTLMSAAILVHTRNGDPFSDSSDAVFIIIILIAYIAIKVRRSYDLNNN